MAIHIVRKINTSAVLATDDDGRSLVVLGRGIGFAEIGSVVDLARVSQTFYDVDQRQLSLLSEMPVEIVEFATQIVQIARGQLSYELSPGTPFVLADHLAFALKRLRKGMTVDMSLAFDIKQQYPLEYRIGKFTVSRMEREFDIDVPEQEAVGIAMVFLNNAASSRRASRGASPDHFGAFLDRVTSVVEESMGVSVDRESFDYGRFATHVRYLYQRALSGDAISSVNGDMYEALCDQYPAACRCVDRIADILADDMGQSLSKEERMYLLLHVNRIVTRIASDDELLSDEGQTRRSADHLM